MMTPEDIYCNSELENDISSITMRDLSRKDISNNGNTQNEAVCYKRSRWFAMVAVFIGLICVLLVVAIILQFFYLTSERDRMKMNYSQLTDEKEKLQKNISSISQKKLELEIQVKNLSNELMKSRYFISSQRKNWSDSRQFCRDHGQDLVIINNEEEQKYISLIAKEDVWIGLSDMAVEGNMIWVDNTPLYEGFWARSEPNNYGGNEDCVEIRLSYSEPFQNNWNDKPCSYVIKWICENL